LNITLTAELKHFIQENLKNNINEVALMQNPFPDFDWKWILNQIKARQKAEIKLPTWFSNTEIVFPNALSIEQTSSEFLANYKASLISGEHLIDLTGGFGVDAYYFSKKFKKVTHCEFQTELSEIVRHNFKVLNVENIQMFCGDSLEYLQNSNEIFDWIYIDPARRDAAKSKVFLLKDCTPNVVELQDFLWTKSNQLLIKTAPLLDLHSITKELNNVKRIYIIALHNEVKELLIVLEKNHTNKPILTAVNLFKNGTLIQHDFEFQDEQTAPYNLPQTYLYEPFSSYLKTGLYNTLAQQFDVKKLHKHSHLYTSDQFKDFPGRVFKIEKVIPYNKKNLKQFEQQKWNVTTRNFPLKVEELRKKHKLKEGGTVYAFFTINLKNEKIVVICKKTNC